jgi:ornithine cyclodeaminase/alanine dehydrogenase-like protein (mu-crystallin family)
MTTILILSRRELESLVPFADYVEAVAEAFRLHAAGRSVAPAPLYIAGEDGGFHVKGASLPLGPGYVAFKTNANFPENKRRAGLPTIQGAVLLLDARTGTPLALLDSSEITIKRTGAATALAARYLARPESATATICGCGAQGKSQVMALRHVLDIRRVFAWDADADAARAYAAEMSGEHGIEVVPARDLASATLASDVIVTCTTSTRPFLGSSAVRPGTFIAAVGADNPHKSELHPELMARAVVVPDVLDQAVYMGDLHHALDAGVMTREDVRAELGTLISGAGPGRARPDEITIFDSTGTGIQDVAAAARAYEVALTRQCGSRIELG